MNVLSLFDGISCARVALDRAGIEVNAYMASEIDKNAIKVSEKNYPDIIRVGSVVDLEVEGQIDLLIGGSPCQDLSIAKKDRKGLEGNRSSLFWEFLRIKKECNPQWFILENVASMPKKDRDIITKEMGVEPIMFNASLVSAQSRKRLFWTNIPFDLPEDKGILLKDILEADVEDKFYVKKEMKTNGKTPTMSSGPALVYVGAVEKTTRKGMEGQEHLSRAHHEGNRIYSADGKAPTLSANGGGIAGSSALIKVGHIGEKDSQTNRIYSADGKAPTQCKGPGGGALPTLIKVGHIGGNMQGNRVYSTEGKATTLSADGGGLAGGTTLIKIRGRDVILNESPLQVLQEGRTELGKQFRKEIKKETGKDSTSRSGGHKAYFGKDGTKANCLTTALGAEGLVVVEQDRIRKLTPIECERLQGLPDNYTEGVATTNRYKCLGNAFNVDVIAHILGRVKLMY
jgi:DNA (cytosine-5)-methyltransferase 3A